MKCEKACATIHQHRCSSSKPPLFKIYPLLPLYWTMLRYTYARTSQEAKHGEEGVCDCKEEMIGVLRELQDESVTRFTVLTKPHGWT